MQACCLSFTSLFLLIPIIIFSFNENKTTSEFILAFLLINNIILSVLFWKNPIKNSLIHFYDGIVAKISYIIFPIYVIFLKDIEYNNKLVFSITFISSSVMFYYSNNYSKICWCSNHHILCHSIFHILISIGTSIAFI
jgi:hypothetical protein